MHVIRSGTQPSQKPFENADATVSRKSVADLVVKLATTPGMAFRDSLSVNKPGS